MSLTLSRIDRVNHTIPVATLFPGFTVATLSVALLPTRTQPTAATVWTTIPTSGSFVATGPDADPTGAIVVPATADLWAKATDSGGQVDAVFVERINVKDSTATVPSASVAFVASVNGKTGTVTLTATDVGAAPAGSVGTVTSVNGKTGAVVLSATDVGADAAGAAATAQAAATSAAATDAASKVAAEVTRANAAYDAAGAATTAQAFSVQRANHTGTQPASTVTGLAAVATSGAYTDLSAKPTIPTVGAAGAGAPVALSSTDAAVTNARTPTAHAASHASGGGDPVTPAAIGADAAGTAATAQAFAIQRTNHTGTQAASTITGLATVATSGAYTDLSGQPTLPPTAPQLISGNYYFPYSPGAVTTSATLGISTLRVVPVSFSRAFSLVRIGAEVTAAGDVGSKVRLGIYADNGAGYPGALTVDAGQIAGDSATVQELAISTGSLAAGIYWFAVAIQAVTTTQPTLRIANIYHAPVPIPAGTTLPAASTTVLGLSTSAITGALPGTFPAGAAAAGSAARIFIKTA